MVINHRIGTNARSSCFGPAPYFLLNVTYLSQCFCDKIPIDVEIFGIVKFHVEMSCPAVAGGQKDPRSFNIRFWSLNAPSILLRDQILNLLSKRKKEKHLTRKCLLKASSLNLSKYCPITFFTYSHFLRPSLAFWRPEGHGQDRPKTVAQERGWPSWFRHFCSSQGTGRQGPPQRSLPKQAPEAGWPHEAAAAELEPEAEEADVSW